MAKHEAYKYQDGDISLDFTFPIEPGSDRKKALFIKLLRAAITELEAELSKK